METEEAVPEPDNEVHVVTQALLKKKVFSAVLKSSLTETQRKNVIRMS